MLAESSSMASTVGVRFRPSGPVVFCDASGIDVAFGDRVEVETDDGDKVATVVIGSGQLIHSDLRGPMFRVMRVVSSSRA